VCVAKNDDGRIFVSLSAQVGWVRRGDDFIEETLPEIVRETAMIYKPGDVILCESSRGFHLVKVCVSNNTVNACALYACMYACGVSVCVCVCLSLFVCLIFILSRYAQTVYACVCCMYACVVCVCVCACVCVCVCCVCVIFILPRYVQHCIYMCVFHVCLLCVCMCVLCVCLRVCLFCV
jgi:hypothetical protein